MISFFDKHNFFSQNCLGASDGNSEKKERGKGGIIELEI